MKPTAAMDTKKDWSPCMAPVEVIQSENSGKKGISGKHTLIALGCLIAVVVIVGGFVAGFYLLKQSADKHSDNMAKMFQMRLHDGRTVVNEKVTTNINAKTTQIETDSENGKAVFFNDFQKGISVFVTPGVSSVCYVSPLTNSSNNNPEAWQNYMRTHPSGATDVDAAGLKEFDDHVVSSDEPISDTSFLGAKINKMCEGKKIYWMHTRKGKLEKPGLSRQKREDCEYSLCIERSCRFCFRGGDFGLCCTYSLGLCCPKSCSECTF